MSHVSKDELRHEWLHICNDISPRTQAASNWIDKLFNEYERDGRYYHDLSHIVQVLNLARVNKSHFLSWPSAFFAIWFHDVVQGQPSGNEYLSAQLATQALTELKVAQSIIKNVVDIILGTAHHTAEKHTDCALVIDCDLSVLGAHPDIYNRYSKQCKLEYPISDFKYRIGRKRFLKKTLSKKYIYQTSLLGNQFEHRARINMTNELETL